MTITHPIARWQPALWFGALFILTLLTGHAVTTTPLFAQHPVLPVAVTSDLLLVMPLLFYCLVVRRYRLPVSSVAGAVGVGLALAHWLIPVAQQQPLRALWLLPALLELSTLAFLLVRASQLVRHYRAARHRGLFGGPALALAARQALGPVGGVLAAEVELLRYALLGWWASPETTPSAIAFSVHRESGFTAVVVVLGLALSVETATVHLLVGHWSMRLAYWLLLADGYTLLLLLAHGQAVRLRPVLLTPAALHLRVGLVWRLVVPRQELVAIEPLCDSPVPASDLLNSAKFLFTTPNLLLTFARPVVVQGPYGIRRTARRLAVYLDQPRQFVAAAQPALK